MQLACRSTSVALLCAASLSTCASPRGEEHTPRTAPDVTVTRFRPPMWTRESMARAQVLYQDGAQSIPIEGGTLWLFGDTFLGRQRAEHADEPPSKAHRPEMAGAESATVAFLPAS